MPPFDYDAWRQSLEPTDQWLLEWRAEGDLSLKEIAAKSGLDDEDLRYRLLRLRRRLVVEATADAAGR